MTASAYDIDQLRYELRRALLAAGISERIVEAIERIAIECIRRNAEVLPALREAIVEFGVVDIGRVLGRYGCISLTTDKSTALELIERMMRGGW